MTGDVKLPGTSKAPPASVWRRCPMVPEAPHLKRAVAPAEVTVSSALRPPQVPTATSPDEVEQATPSASAAVPTTARTPRVTAGAAGAARPRAGRRGGR